MFALKKRKGFALPLAILLLAVLTASIAAGFAATSGEIVSNNAQRAQDRAYQIAEAGLQQFMVRRNEAGFCSNCAADPLLADSEYTRVDIPGGYADVVSFRIRPRISDTIPAIYFIRSKGVDMTVRLRASTSSGSNTTNFAERTVGQYATWNTSTVRVIGAWTSLSGVTKNGTAGEISGIDQCNPGGPGVAGVTVPAGGNLTTSGGWAPTGTPPTDSTSSLDSLKSRAGIDWNGIINQNSMPADYTEPGNGFPTVEQFNDTSFWPVIRIKTNGFSLPHAGRGIIIADSNFTISGSNMWDGILMVGGKLTSNGNNTTAGATLSGLNMMLPGAVSPGPGETSDDATANGQKTYVYSSCKVSRAAQRLRVYFSLANTWMDNVAIW